MHLLAGFAGFVLLCIVLTDTLNTIVLARRVGVLFRPTRLFYRWTWSPYAGISRRIPFGPARESFLSVYGQLSILVLVALWAAGLILAFGLMQWAARLRVTGLGSTFTDALYFSAGSVFTLLVGSPLNGLSRLLVTAEAGIGLALLALVIGYFPALYQAFAGRERNVAMLAARAGSPPTACELLRGGPGERRVEQLADWERWCAHILGSHLS